MHESGGSSYMMAGQMQDAHSTVNEVQAEESAKKDRTMEHNIVNPR